MLDHLLAIGLRFTILFSLKIRTQRANHVHIEACDVVIVVMDVLILLIVLGLQLFNCAVFLCLNLGNLLLTLCLHILTEARHLGLVLFLDLVADALEFLALGRGLSVEVLIEGVLILCLAHLLFLLLDFECAQVLL